MTDERLTVLSLFSGIGGIDLGLERAGMRVIGQCEIDKYCRTVLERHWPGVPFISDVRDVGAALDVRADIIAGGFPCQPVSQAGRRLAQEDPRWLWPQVARVVRELQPRVVFLENVPGLVRRGFTDVLTDLAEAGFDAVWGSLRASDVGAPHRRERVFVIATPTDSGGLGRAREQALDSTHGGVDVESGDHPDGCDLAATDAGGAGRRQVAGGTPSDEGAAAGRSADADHVARGARASGLHATEPTPADADGEREEPGAGGELRAAIVHGPTRRNTTGIDTWGRPNLGRPKKLLPTPTGDDANNVTRSSGSYLSLARSVNELSTGASTPPQSPDGDTSAETPPPAPSTSEDA